jgi:predicted transcriptional regulator
MGRPKLTKLELQVLEALWRKGVCSVREILEEFPEPGRPAYTAVQTVVYRLEHKQAWVMNSWDSEAGPSWSWRIS